MPLSSIHNRRQPDGRKRYAPAQRDHCEPRGRSRGELGIKACALPDSFDPTIALALAPKQAHKLPHSTPLFNQLSGVPGWIVVYRKYTSPAIANTSATWVFQTRDPSAGPVMAGSALTLTESSTSGLG